MRRTRKGGMRTEIIPCGDYDTCLDNYLEMMNLKLINVKPDGNCFFHSLAKHLTFSKTSLSDLRLPYESAPTLHKTLRRIVTDTMKKHGRNVSRVLQNSDKTPLEVIEDLAKDGAWYDDSGDIIPQFAARALNITLVIYNMTEPIEAKTLLNKKITCNACLKHYNRNCTKCIKTYREKPAVPGSITVYTFEPDGESNATISLLREENHYQLLYPGSAGSPGSQRSPNRTRKSLERNMMKLAISESKVGVECGHKCKDKRACAHPCCKRHLY